MEAMPPEKEVRGAFIEEDMSFLLAAICTEVRDCLTLLLLALFEPFEPPPFLRIVGGRLSVPLPLLLLCESLNTERLEVTVPPLRGGESHAPPAAVPMSF